MFKKNISTGTAYLCTVPPHPESGRTTASHRGQCSTALWRDGSVCLGVYGQWVGVNELLGNQSAPYRSDGEYVCPWGRYPDFSYVISGVPAVKFIARIGQNGDGVTADSNLFYGGGERM